MNCKKICMRTYQALINHSLDMFDTITIETMSQCNRKCSYCPVSNYRRPDEYLSNDVVKKVLNNLKEMNFLGSIMWGFYNEPMLDERIYQFVDDFNKTLPRCRQTLFTNGDFITPEKVERLKSNGIRTIILSRHGGVRGLDSIVESIEVDPKMFQINVISADSIGLSTRGGIINVTNPGPLIKKCDPRQFFVSASGKVAICCNDWKGDNAFKNLNISGSSLKDVWYCQEFVSLRKELRNGKRPLTICQGCNGIGSGFICSGEEYLKRVRTQFMHDIYAKNDRIKY